MNLTEGLRRITVVIGLIGFILGAFIGFGEIKDLIRRTQEYERYAVILKTKTMARLKGVSCPGPWAKYRVPDGYVPDLEATQVGGCFINYGHPVLTENTDGIQKVQLDSKNQVVDVELSDGDTIFSSTRPSVVEYLEPVIWPVCGLLIPLALFWVLSWIFQGFVKQPVLDKS